MYRNPVWWQANATVDARANVTGARVRARLVCAKCPCRRRARANSRCDATYETNMLCASSARRECFLYLCEYCLFVWNCFGTGDEEGDGERRPAGSLSQYVLRVVGRLTALVCSIFTRGVSAANYGGAIFSRKARREDAHSSNKTRRRHENTRRGRRRRRTRRHGHRAKSMDMDVDDDANTRRLGLLPSHPAHHI